MLINIHKRTVTQDRLIFSNLFFFIHLTFWNRLESTTSSFVDGTSSIELGGVPSSYAGGGIAKLYPRKRLKGYYGNYTITVKASDRGTPSNSATEKYSICVQANKLSN